MFGISFTHKKKYSQRAVISKKLARGRRGQRTAAKNPVLFNTSEIFESTILPQKQLFPRLGYSLH